MPPSISDALSRCPGCVGEACEAFAQVMATGADCPDEEVAVAASSSAQPSESTALVSRAGLLEDILVADHQCDTSSASGASAGKSHTSHDAASGSSSSENSSSDSESSSSSSS